MGFWLEFYLFGPYFGEFNDICCFRFFCYFLYSAWSFFCWEFRFFWPQIGGFNSYIISILLKPFLLFYFRFFGLFSLFNTSLKLFWLRISLFLVSLSCFDTIIFGFLVFFTLTSNWMRGESTNLYIRWRVKKIKLPVLMVSQIKNLKVLKLTTSNRKNI